MSRRAVTDDERARVRDLHGAGHGRNVIAREIGRSAATVTKIAQELGLTFDREATRVAVQAKQLTAAERRAALALDLLADAQRLRSRMWTPVTVYSFGGKDNTYAEQEIDEPSAQDKAALMRAASVAIDRSLRLDEYDRDGGVDTARSLVGGLMAALAESHRAAADDASDG